jgi:hypothetical protein
VDYAFYGGAALSSNPFPTPAVHQEFWQRHRSTLLRWYRDGVPADFASIFGFAPGDPCRAPHGKGCAPHSWWLFDAPERRRIVGIEEMFPRGDTGFYDFVTRPPTEEEISEIWERCGGGTFCGAPQYGGLYEVESEEAYFARLGIQPEETFTA